MNYHERPETSPPPDERLELIGALIDQEGHLEDLRRKRAEIDSALDATVAKIEALSTAAFETRSRLAAALGFDLHQGGVAQNKPAPLPKRDW